MMGGRGGGEKRGCLPVVLGQIVSKPVGGQKDRNLARASAYFFGGPDRRLAMASDICSKSVTMSPKDRERTNVFRGRCRLRVLGTPARSSNAVRWATTLNLFASHRWTCGQVQGGTDAKASKLGAPA